LDLSEVIPPDDGGRDAFERFRYQAHVAFPSCLVCGAAQGVTAVICEHIEDVCIEEDERVRFQQIKTRNPDYGLWRLRDLCAERGAFRSLLRTHRAVSDVEDDREFVYEAVLEGALERNDPIRQFPPEGDGVVDDDLARQVLKLMKGHTPLRLGEARQFLARIRILTSASRDSIAALNFQQLMGVAGDLPASELKEIYDRCIERISQAMSGTLLSEWPQILFDADDSQQSSVEAKRLEQGAIAALLGAVLSGTAPALSEITDPDLLKATALEKKLRSAGAPAELVDQAKQLRANATRREIEVLSQSLRSDAENRLEDLRQRLLVGANASLSLHSDAPSPASAVYADLLQRLGAQPRTYDPSNMYQRDPALLMGGVCDLSDRCRFAWRSDG